jgi:Dolichyl-phosphate-mannose-protein mannosyltransferase
MFHFIALSGLLSLCMLALVVAHLLVRFGGWQDRHGLALAAGFACAPTLMGLLAWPLIGFGLRDILLASSGSLVALVLLIFLRGKLFFLSLIKPLQDGPRWLAIACLGLALAILVQALSLAIVENDALEYLMTGRLIIRDGGLMGYPFIVADQATGFYAPAIHPPTFHLLMAWGIGSTPDGALLTVRLACAMAVLATALIAAHLRGGVSREAPFFAAILVLATPILVAMATSFNADAPRIAAFVAAMAGVVVALERPGRTTIVAAGLLSALAMWAHSAGLMAPAFAVMAFLISGRRGPGLRLASLFLATAVLFGGGWYFANAVRYGHVISDQWPAAQWPFLGYVPDMLARRGLETPAGLLMNGALQTFTDAALIGIAFWLAAVALIFRQFRWDRATDLVSLVAVGGFLGVGLAMAFLGSDTIIKNMRYAMTVAPMAAVLGAGALAAAFSGHRFLSGGAVVVCVLVVGWAGLSMGLRGWGLSSALPMAGAAESWALKRARFAGGPLLDQLRVSGADRILTFRQSDLVHRSGLRWVDHFDPALKDIHGATPAAAAEALSERHVRWIYVPASTPVTVLNSALGAVLGAPDLSEPVAEHRGAKLFLLLKTGQGHSCKADVPLAAQMIIHTASLADRLAAALRLPQISNFSARETKTNPIQLPTLLGQPGDWVSDLRLVPLQPIAGRFAASLRLSGNTLFEIAAELTDAEGRRRRLPLINGLAPATDRALRVQWLAEGSERLTALVITRPHGLSGQLKAETVSLCQL